jgi:hypothetical protein
VIFPIGTPTTFSLQSSQANLRTEFQTGKINHATKLPKGSRVQKFEPEPHKSSKKHGLQLPNQKPSKDSARISSRNMVPFN